MNKLAPYSMSRLTEYERCPKRFRFKYIDKLPELVGDEGFKGIKIHEAIANALKGKDYKNILAEIAFDDIRDAEYMVKSAVKHSKNLGKILGIETKFGITQKGELTDFFSKDVWLRGVADLITTQDGKTLEVWDWKTGHSTPTKFQVFLYAWAISIALQRPVTRVGYIMLNSNDILIFDVTSEDL
ncbi:PD-(D/E)XK nuclease family protein [Marinitoga lauensis]|uniref:PD-(D/E)XK nuclease family protein n=1 Tax=Marinitoga lauensis TaxID=2201189 RepID=UPI0010123D94|nr:PD-(D/E)XK nuclease family protein [Marinitoga lauensis]